MDYILHILILISIYALLAASLDLLAGHTGIVSVGHAAFYGVGAYTSAILAVQFGYSFLVGAAIGMLIAVLLSLVVAASSGRLRGDYFLIVTLAFQLVVSNLLNNWTEMTRGPLGFVGIPDPEIAGVALHTRGEFVLLALTFSALFHGVAWRIYASPFGRVLRAIREDERFAQAIGKNVLLFKMAAVGVSAAGAALAGSVYAHYVTYIDPTTFTLMESVLVLSMVIVGGAGRLLGPALGAMVLVGIPELLRLVGLTGGSAANVQQMLYGALLTGMIAFRPRGLVGRHDFGR
jgi:branched-chain amino acid transport system permease protein